jgi:hypothetical protein
MIDVVDPDGMRSSSALRRLVPSELDKWEADSGSIEQMEPRMHTAKFTSLVSSNYGLGLSKHREETN